jgi:hypothetical protein
LIGVIQLRAPGGSWHADTEVVTVTGDRCRFLDLRGQPHDDMDLVRIVCEPGQGRASTRLEIIRGIKNALDTVPRLDQRRNPDDGQSVLVRFVRGHCRSVPTRDSKRRHAWRLVSSLTATRTGRCLSLVAEVRFVRHHLPGVGPLVWEVALKSR